MNPAQSEMRFTSPGIRVDRHESGQYRVTLASGHDEQMWPDGTYFVIGDTTPHDMQQESPTWNPPTQPSPAPVVFHHSSGFEITVQPNGDTTINIPDSLNLSGNVSVGSGSHPVALADVLLSWLNGHTHDAPSGGGTTSAPITPVSGIAASKLTTD